MKNFMCFVAVLLCTAFISVDTAEATGGGRGLFRQRQQNFRQQQFRQQQQFNNRRDVIIRNEFVAPNRRRRIVEVPNLRLNFNNRDELRVTRDRFGNVIDVQRLRRGFNLELNSNRNFNNRNFNSRNFNDFRNFDNRGRKITIQQQIIRGY